MNSTWTSLILKVDIWEARDAVQAVEQMTTRVRIWHHSHTLSIPRVALIELSTPALLPLSPIGCGPHSHILKNKTKLYIYVYTSDICIYAYRLCLQSDVFIMFIIWSIDVYISMNLVNFSWNMTYNCTIMITYWLQWIKNICISFFTFAFQWNHSENKSQVIIFPTKPVLLTCFLVFLDSYTNPSTYQAWSPEIICKTLQPSPCHFNLAPSAVLSLALVLVLFFFWCPFSIYFHFFRHYPFFAKPFNHSLPSSLSSPTLASLQPESLKYPVFISKK